MTTVYVLTRNSRYINGDNVSQTHVYRQKEQADEQLKRIIKRYAKDKATTLAKLQPDHGYVVDTHQTEHFIDVTRTVLH